MVFVGSKFTASCVLTLRTASLYIGWDHAKIIPFTDTLDEEKIVNVKSLS